MCLRRLPPGEWAWRMVFIQTGEDENFNFDYVTIYAIFNLHIRNFYQIHEYYVIHCRPTFMCRPIKYRAKFHNLPTAINLLNIKLCYHYL
jgi:hypothetical protein